MSTEQEISTNAKLEDLVRKYNLKFLDEYSTDLMPVIVQDFATNEVLMLGFANLEAVRTTFRKKLATFWSRSRSRLWTKGETSGNFLTLVEMKIDCDNDSLLYLVTPSGPTCHTGQNSCFYRSLVGD